MMIINDEAISHELFQARFAELETLLQSLRVQSLAVCIPDALDWLILCQIAEKTNLTLMPLHADLPEKTAFAKAERAGCQVLLHGHVTQVFLTQSHLNTDYSEGGLIQMSSGTTGEPKSIFRTWASIRYEVDQYVTHFTATEGLIPIIACPVTHSYGLICGVMVAQARGVTPVIVTHVNPKYLMKLLTRYPHSILYSSPPMLHAIGLLWRSSEPIHAVMTSGSVMPDQTFDLLKTKVTHLYQQYGCSEAGCVSIADPMTAPNDMGSALPHISIQCSDQDSAPSEIVVHRCDNDALETIHTQDFGYLDDEQRVRFIARMDDTIIVAGLNVYPDEIEQIIREHSLIDDAVVYKKEDAFSGQRVCFQYVSQVEIPKSELLSWCQQHLATFQCPYEVIRVRHIPRLANGKVNRKQIAESPDRFPDSLTMPRSA